MPAAKSIDLSQRGLSVHGGNPVLDGRGNVHASTTTLCEQKGASKSDHRRTSLQRCRSGSAIVAAAAKWRYAKIRLKTAKLLSQCRKNLPTKRVARA
jgi:hypothetical protein